MLNLRFSNSGLIYLRFKERKELVNLKRLCETILVSIHSLLSKKGKNNYDKRRFPTKKRFNSLSFQRKERAAA
ncbi:hypothetical protein G436_3742 [Leptospira interrogans serovar Hardjo str. Norma]|uniref:Uncharacterized protein n=2 Tax=Leptospira interrogans TaxID=173 RepID=A0A0F6H8B8_LEPIR|nr:hypothetical protein G436_3742 [Leptospira interrogans serovar Hardjo str. Norma]EKO24490.1 hypothetical protein LEP1GSC104_0652 [Leptospira interrogans str. UI 12621]EKO94670.1 hypothetical protein LEP1GSC057_4540 [Leptospira interrogans str. Brem 329]EKR19553.1 hypothetical protein LEP1GSC019_0275 [Leptospira interrogans serovar Pyrogenes str. 2006006960]